MSKKISYGGILAALSLLFLYITGVTPSGKLALVAASSYCIGLSIVYVGMKFSLVSYVAVSALGILLVPNKMVAVLFIIFFGTYPFLKCYIEKINKLALEWVLKIFAFNIYVLILLYIAIKVFMMTMVFDDVFFILIMVLNIAFMIYDIMFNFVITKILMTKRGRNL